MDKIDQNLYKIVKFLEKKEFTSIEMYIIGRKLIKEVEDDAFFPDVDIEDNEIDEFEEAEEPEQEETIEEQQEKQVEEKEEEYHEEPQEEEYQEEQERPIERQQIQPRAVPKPIFAKKPPMVKKTPVDDFLSDF